MAIVAAESTAIITGINAQTSQYRHVILQHELPGGGTADAVTHAHAGWSDSHARTPDADTDPVEASGDFIAGYLPAIPAHRAGAAGRSASPSALLRRLAGARERGKSTDTERSILVGGRSPEGGSV